MGLISAIALFVTAILAAAPSRLIADEFKAWTPWAVRGLIDYAVRLAPMEHQDRLLEEWSSHANDVPGTIGKFTVALGFVRAAWKITPELERDLPFAVTKGPSDNS